MVVSDLNLVRIPILPPEADPVLIVYPNAVLPRPIPLEQLQSVARQRLQIPK
jgi:hypothetical protein